MRLRRFDDILKRIKIFEPEERRLIGEVMIVCKLLHDNPATSVSAERSFSMAMKISIATLESLKKCRIVNFAGRYYMSLSNLLKSLRKRTVNKYGCEVASLF